MTTAQGGAGDVWEIPILDGFSFSQATNTTEVTLNEAALPSKQGKSRRSRQMFNDSYAPAEWSFSTYMRPFKGAGVSGDGDKRWELNAATDAVHSVEEPLWANFVSNPTFTKSASSTAAAWTAPDITHASNTLNPIVNGQNSKTINFRASEASALGTFNLYFEMGGADALGSESSPTTYKIADCVVNEVSIDFDIDGIATLNWSGFGRIISQDSTPTTTITEAIEATNNFIRNRLTVLNISTGDDHLLAAGETGDGGTDDEVYDIVLTGGNITFTNNITFLMPETLGVVNQAIGHVPGTRSISGSFTAYLNNETSAGDESTAELFERIIEDTDTITNVFNLRFNIGGIPKLANGSSYTFDGTSTAGGNYNEPTDDPTVVISMPRCHLEVPTHQIEDIISMEMNFHALPVDIDPATNNSNAQADYEALITYSGPLADNP